MNLRSRAPLLACVLAVPVAAAAVAGGLDPSSALPPLVGLALFAFALFSRVEVALTVVLAAAVPGALARVLLGAAGAKPLPIRPEEIAIAGLVLGSGPLLWRELRETPLLRRWVLFTLVAAGGFVASLRLWEPGAMLPGALYLARWIGYGAVLVAATHVARDAARRERLLSHVVAVAVALSLLGVVQLLALPDMRDLKQAFPDLRSFLTDPHIGRLVSTVLDPNLLGALLAIVAPILLARLLVATRGTRVTPALQLVTIAIALVLTVSRGSLLALVLGLATTLLVMRPGLVLAVLPIVPVVGLVAPRLFDRFRDGVWAPDGTPMFLFGLELRPEPSALARVGSWVRAIEVVEEHPLAGVGFNNYGLAQAERGDPAAVLFGTDSSLLLVLATCGVVGLFAFVAFLWQAVLDARRASGSADGRVRSLGAGALGSLAAIALASLFTNALFHPTVLVVLWTVVAVVSREAGDTASAPVQAARPARLRRLALDAG